MRVVDSVMPTFGFTERDGYKIPHVTLAIKCGRRDFFFRFAGEQAAAIGDMIGQAAIFAMADCTGFSSTRKFKREYGDAPDMMREST